MNCEQTRPLLLDYLLEETSAEARQNIALHLETCSTCSEEVGRLRQTISLVEAAEPKEEIPQRFRLAPEPANWWTAFWHSTAQLSFATAIMACLAVILLAVFQTHISFEQGNFNLAFGAAPAIAQPEATTEIQAVNGATNLDRAAVLELIAQEVAASEDRITEENRIMIQTAAQRADQRWRSDIQEVAESLRYFQSSQTMMWKEQVQSQQVVSNWLQQAGMTSERP